ncbi:EamA family transporter [Paenibacillus tepidiphilus]|uniref:EamA family transporter n=1 Tax=Paenibacillus tepidiphilus TaxID=2608683 RepID=UPI001238B578|nr:EamA family transporter [Paenibacillus tepidiphilus]
MWVIYAFGSALFAGITAVLAKIGIHNTDSNLATALRTVVVLLFSWALVWIAGSADTIPSISGRTLLFLLLSGLATGASWLCYFRALQLGNVNKVTPVDKSSTILTILLAFVFLGETPSVAMWCGILLLAAGTWLMIQRKSGEASVQSRSWLLYAVLSAGFAALTSILGKIGIEDIESGLGTAIRTIAVLVMAWGIVFYQKKHRELRSIERRSWWFLGLSGLATGLSWLCYYRALQEGPASLVVPIDKLSIVVTVAFSWMVLKEKLSRKAFAGLLLVVAGTLLMLL